jgi:hypothetical protein
MNEALAIDILCALFGGDQEVRHAYNTDYSANYIQVDCETEEFVMEMGLDKRSSFDSIHQVTFASILTGKKPKIVIIDTDLREKAQEYQIRLAAQKLGIAYQSVYLKEIEKLLEIPEVRARLGMDPRHGD